MRLAHWLMAQASPGRVVAAFFAMLAVLLGALTLARTELAVGRAMSAMPDAHLAYDGAGLAVLIRTLVENTTATSIAYALDLLMPVTSAAFLSLWLAHLVAANGRQHTGWRRAIALPLLAAGFDLLENATVITLVALYPSEIIGKLHLLLRSISGLKWTFYTGAIVSVVALLVVSLRRQRARPSA